MSCPPGSAGPPWKHGPTWKHGPPWLGGPDGQGPSPEQIEAMRAAWQSRSGEHMIRWRRRAMIAVGVFLILTILLLVAGSLLVASAVGGAGPRGLMAVIASGAVLVFGLRLSRKVLGRFSDVVDATEASRRALLSDLAHELRTPLTVVRANVEGMLDGLYEPDGDRLQLILGEVEVMQRLLEDLATLSTAESGSLELDRRPVDPGRLAEQVVAAHDGAAREAGVVMTVERVEPLPDAVPVDEVRLHQVLGNLVTNAIRHTPAGGQVTVEVRSSKGPFIDFVVSDTGEGFEPDLLADVFDRFVRSDRGGTGLGLAVAKRLVEAHGGVVEAGNDPAGGARVVVRLPMDPRRRIVALDAPG